MKTNSYYLPIILAVVTLLAAACGSLGASAGTANDKLAEIKDRGTLVIAINLDYPPFSAFDKSQQRAADTKCAADQYTGNQFVGFDAGTAVEIAKRLGVEPCFVSPDWGVVISGDWKDAWDIHVGSMSITNARMELFYFSQPYYATTSYVFVHKDNTTYQTPEDLSGKRIGTCVECTFELYLKENLNLPGPQIQFRIKNADASLFDTEIPAIEELSLGDGEKLDGVITQRSTGTQAIKNGAPLRMLSQPLFFEYIAASFDKKSVKDSTSLVNEVTKIIQEMQNDGTLPTLAKGNIEADLVPLAADFYIEGLNQFPK